MTFEFTDATLKKNLEIIERYHSVINSHRPLTQEERKGIDNYFRVHNTYSSNAIDGNVLTVTETKVLLENGVLVRNQFIKEGNEMKGHAKAYDFMLKTARKDKLVISEEVILRLHELFYSDCEAESVTAGKYRTTEFELSRTDHVPPSPKDISKAVSRYINELEKQIETLPAIIAASLANLRFVNISPFKDGNKRTARLIMNMILIHKKYCLLSIPPAMKRDYRIALRIAERKEDSSDIPFFNLMAECQIAAQKDYCRMLHISISI